MDILTQGLLDCGIAPEYADSVAQKMEAYINEIILFNSAYNLTNTSEHDELVTRHILDSLAAYKELSRLMEALVNAEAGTEAGAGAGGGFVLADIGSGGGLPGIPLASVFLHAFPGARIRLVERMEKRCAFLENCAAILGLTNVEVVNSEAERLDEAGFDLITFRAFRPLDKKMTRTLLRIVRPQGYLCAYKAKIENIRGEMDGIKALIPEYDVLPLSVPGLEDSERNLVVIRKQ